MIAAVVDPVEKHVAALRIASQKLPDYVWPPDSEIQLYGVRQNVEAFHLVKRIWVS